MLSSRFLRVPPNWYENLMSLTHRRDGLIACSRYEVDDAEREWTYPEDLFDFIHARNLGQSIDDWPRMLRQAYRCLQPGGYVELAEIGGEFSYKRNCRGSMKA
jgi:SAM-dependent methyltransferase